MKFLIPDKWYNILKQVALVFLPAVATLYFMLGSTWEWTNIEQVLGTIAAFETFLGAILGLTTRSYNKSEERFDGTIHSTIEEDTGNLVYSLELNEDPETIPGKSAIVFKVDAS